mmetsp:Transcript_74997/g.217692  ORF Transcript_74997/g.217692 Transcript_74997/m.217692 type:complete len:241 (+) Transcript_74997:58-780(+)
MFSCRACCSDDRRAAVEKFDAPSPTGERARAEMEDEEERLLHEERERERILEEQRLALEEEQRVRAEEESRRQEEQEKELRAAEEEERRARLDERHRAEEDACKEVERLQNQRLAQEAFEREQARLQKEAEEAKEAEEERARKASVAAFLRGKGFTAGAGGPKKSLMGTTYPLHEAAKAGNVELVRMLLKEGAAPSQKNSSGKTAAQVAEKSNKRGSHSAVLSALAGCEGDAPSGRIGGC